MQESKKTPKVAGLPLAYKIATELYTPLMQISTESRCLLSGDAKAINSLKKYGKFHKIDFIRIIHVFLAREYTKVKPTEDCAKIYRQSNGDTFDLCETLCAVPGPMGRYADLLISIREIYPGELSVNVTEVDFVGNEETKFNTVLDI